MTTTIPETRTIRAPRGTRMSCRGWQQGAALRMMMNNLDPEVAERPAELIVYGGTGKAARNWECFDAIVRELRNLGADETLLVQSGKPVGVFRTHAHAPRVLIANSNLVGRWATWEHFRELERRGLMMYGQMTAGSWIYIGSQGIVQGTYETFAAAGKAHWNSDLTGRFVLSGGLGGMGGSQPLAATMAGGVVLGVAMQRAGAHVFDYGNNLRAQAELGGAKDANSYPGFVPAYIRPLFCEGKGPFRWAALSGDPDDIRATDEAVLDEIKHDAMLHRWMKLAREKIAFQGLPARICWLGYGQRHRVGLRFNELVRTGKVKAPIVIGRDHLDSGSVASPNRETEAMKDGSDAIADWAILNALVNTAAGATWVSFHHGGGVGMGMSLHAGMVVVADGTPEAARRLERVLTSDPGMGVIRHADAGYEEAIACAREKGVHVPHRRA